MYKVNSSYSTCLTCTSGDEQLVQKFWYLICRPLPKHIWPRLPLRVDLNQGCKLDLCMKIHHKGKPITGWQAA